MHWVQCQKNGSLLYGPFRKKKLRKKREFCWTSSCSYAVFFNTIHNKDWGIILSASGRFIWALKSKILIFFDIFFILRGNHFLSWVLQNLSITTDLHRILFKLKKIYFHWIGPMTDSVYMLRFPFVVPSWKPRFPVDWRLLVKERITIIG